MALTFGSLFSRWLILPLTLFVSAFASAQMVDAQGKTIEVFQVDEAPVIDGFLNDEAWKSATAIEDFHQVNPEEYGPPSEKSSIYVVYTKDALFVAGRFQDSEPDEIVAMVLRQGDYSFGEDSVTIMIDPFNKSRSGYAFDLNPNGVRSQAVYENVTSENWSWHGIWHGAASQDDKGWIAEIEIPFKTLSFDPHNETWGLNVARYIGRKSEHIGWVSSNREQNPAVSGKMHGFSGLEQGVGLDIVPSVGANLNKVHATGHTSTTLDPSLDLFYKLTPAMTAALTINTDFSGTGVDSRQINLTRFGLFFPERRAFFLQDTDIFEFGLIGGRGYKSRTTLSRVENESGRPFFSRRIGLSYGGETIDINVGGKLTGRAGRWNVGMLAVRQDEFDGLDSSDLFVARVTSNVLTESSLGVILTHGDPVSNFVNALAGVDFSYLNTRLGNGGTLKGSLWYQSSDTEDVDGDDAAYGISLQMPNAVGWRGGIAYKELQENFYPALGFVNRVNVSDFSSELGYTWYPQSDTIQLIHTGVDYQRIETLQGELESQIITLRPLEIENYYDDKVNFRYHIIDENLVEPWEISEGIIIPVGLYSYSQYCVSFESGPFRKLSGWAHYCGGEFFDGRQSEAGVSLIWRPSKHLRFSASYNVTDIVLPNGAFTTRLGSLSADIAFTSTWYWENLLQYDNVSDSMGLNSILRWIPRAGREMVFEVRREYIDPLENRSFEVVSDDITFKYSHTYRF
jgi:hypothetical protein